MPVHGNTRRRLGQAGPADHAEVVLRGGRVYTGAADGTEVVEAIALAGGEVLAVGSDDALMSRAGRDTEVVDLDGRTVVPGLIDSHVHVVRAGLSWLDEVSWFEVGSLRDGLALIERRARSEPVGTWMCVIGGWHPGQFREGRGPTRAELTALAPEHPVYVQLLYEEAVLNDAAVAACGIDRATSDPAQGAFERDPDSGEPTGVIRGVDAFNHCLAHIPTAARRRQAEGTRALLSRLAGYGLTGVIDPGGLGLAPQQYVPVFDVWRAGELALRLRLYMGPLTRGAELDEVDAWIRHVHPRQGDDWLRVVGIGELLLFAYHDLEGLTPLEIGDEHHRQLLAVCTELAARGWPLHLHTVREATVRAVLDVWEQVDRATPLRPLRWSLAHAEGISARDLDRVRSLDAGIAVQDRLIFRAADSARAWGTDAVRMAPPLRDILDRGIPLGGGTDATRVTSPNPWTSLWWLVTGRTFDAGPERDAVHRLTRKEALAAYTSGSAWFSFEEDRRGRLEPGMAADLAVLSDDYFAVADDAIRDLRSVLTLVDGRPVHAIGPYAGLG